MGKFYSSEQETTTNIIFVLLLDPIIIKKNYDRLSEREREREIMVDRREKDVKIVVTLSAVLETPM